jgi:hypothetical protein
MGKTLDKILRGSFAAAALGIASLAGNAIAEPANYSPAFFAQQQKQAQKSPPPVVTESKEKELRKAYESDKAYKAKDPAFFDTIYKDALDPKNDADSRWVLLQLAQEYAENTSNIDGAFKVIDYLNEQYEGIRAIAKKCGVMDKARKKAKTVEQAEMMVDLDFLLIDAALEKGDFKSAKDMAEATKKDAAMAKSPQLVQRATLISNEITDYEKEYIAATSKDTETAAAGGDAAASQTLGMYHYFALRDQKKGTEFLKNAKDASLKKAGGLEFMLDQNPVPESQKEVADAWYDAIKGKSGLEKRRIQTTAFSHYKKAIANAPPALQRTYDMDKELQKRLKELAAVQMPGIPVNLLTKVDIARDKMKGTWEYRSGVLTSPASAPFQFYQFAWKAPEEYTLTLEVVLKGEPSMMYIGLPMPNNKHAHIGLDARAATVAPHIALADGSRYESKDSKTFADAVKGGRKCKVTCAVTNTQVLVNIDDKKLLDWRVDPKQLMLTAIYGAPSVNAPVIATSTQFEYRKASIEPGAGYAQGEPLPR